MGMPPPPRKCRSYEEFSLHVQPGRVDEFQLLVGSRAPPLYFDLARLVQAEGTVAVVHGSQWIVATEVALSTVARVMCVCVYVCVCVCL